MPSKVVTRDLRGSLRKQTLLNLTSRLELLLSLSQSSLHPQVGNPFQSVSNRPHETVRRKGLFDNVILSTLAKCVHRDLFVRQTSQDHNGNVAGNLFRSVQRVQTTRRVRQTKIEQHKVCFILCQQLKTFLEQLRPSKTK